MANTWIDIDTGILGENLRALKECLSPKTEIMFVVKANAYGHGMIAVSRCARELGVRWFGVIHADEGERLRRELPDARIVLLGVTQPSEIPAILENNLIPVIVSEPHAIQLRDAVRKVDSEAQLRCHAKVDTGMGRLGFAWEDAGRALSDLAQQPGLNIVGICTHLAASSGPDKTFSRSQLDRFRGVVTACEKNNLFIPFKHVSNSGGILQDGAWDFNAVRAGILVYGYARKAGEEARVKTRPFLQWKTRLLQVKKVPAGFPVSYDGTHVTRQETHIGTIDAGYADGYSRLLGNKGFVLIGGKRRPVVGRVTMNLVMVDLGPENDAREWDEVVLLGSQGKEAIWADEMAEWRGTISYEVLTDIRTEDRRIIGRS